MATALDFIKQSLRDIGVLAAGEDPSFDDSNDALEALNALLDQWAAQRLKMFTITRSTWTIVSGTQEYTFGTGGDLTTRPVWIDAAAYLDTSQSTPTEIPMELLTEQAWQGVRQKTQESVYPQVAYYNPTVATGTLSLYPVPTSSTLTGIIYWPQPIAQLATLNTTVTVPSGYRRFMTKTLALELCPAYGKEPSQELREQAMDAKAAVMRANKRTRDMQFDRGALIGTRRRTYDIYTE
jgi:hypothetical protein